MRLLAVSVNDFITGLDPAIEVSPKKFYVAYKTSQNIVCMEVKHQRVLLYLTVCGRSSPAREVAANEDVDAPVPAGR